MDADSTSVVEQELDAALFQCALDVADGPFVGEPIAGFEVTYRSLRHTSDIRQVLLRQAQPTARGADLLTVNHECALMLQLCSK